ncbi:MAG TPA: ATP-binding protein [Kofleriaceae bacterium]|nr:ATP-binding protein [Kofleriaceae bacterium]
MSGDPIERLQQLAALGEIGAGVSHETRNLMSAILGFAQVGKRADDPDSARRYFELIERESMRCLEILERYLQFGRADGGEPVDVDLGRAIQQIANATGHQLAMRRIKLVVALAAQPIVHARCDALQQVLLNLVINAMHATPGGGEIAIATARSGELVEIAVSDTGCGVPAELRERIFEPFFTTKPSGEGTGLGLALCRRMIEAQGGTIELDPTTASGARFVVRLPVKRW